MNLKRAIETAKYAEYAKGQFSETHRLFTTHGMLADLFPPFDFRVFGVFRGQLQLPDFR